MNNVFGGTVIESDGRIIVGGNDGLSLQLLALTSSGAVDTTFGNAGFTTPQLALISSMTLDANGRILVGGSGSLGSAGGAGIDAGERFTPQGVLDSTFGTGGTTEVTFTSLPRTLRFRTTPSGWKSPCSATGRSSWAASSRWMPIRVGPCAGRGSVRQQRPPRPLVCRARPLRRLCNEFPTSSVSSGGDGA